MTGRYGFLGGPRQSDAPERDADGEFGSGAVVGSPSVRLGDPNGRRSEAGSSTPPDFDPVWGTLGAPIQDSADDWSNRSEDDVEGVAVDVEILGDGFHIAGQIQIGQFDRLSGWLNMKSGFIRVRNSVDVHHDQTNPADPDQRKGTLWVRLNQVVMVAERSAVQKVRPGAPVVQKHRREVLIVTPGYKLRGSIHVQAHGAMAQFLESPDGLFIPVTDLTVRWLSNAASIAQFPFALVNREQLVTVFDEAITPAGEVAHPEVQYA